MKENNKSDFLKKASEDAQQENTKPFWLEKSLEAARKENGVTNELRKAFKAARQINSEMIVIFTYSLRFDVYATNYGAKMDMVIFLEACQNEGLLTHQAVIDAQKYFEHNSPGGAKVIHHFAKDTDIMVDREEVWMFHNFTR